MGVDNVTDDALHMDWAQVYNRLFTKILDSSIWLEPSSTRIVWITLLAAMDEDGYAHFSAIQNLADRAHVSLEDTKKAIQALSAPDPESENQDNEGRRLERVPGGFIVLNAKHHRGLLNREIKREQTRIRVARHRAKLNGNEDSVTLALHGVTPASDSASKSKPHTEEEVIVFCESIHLPKTDGHYYWDKWQGNGFKNAGKPMKDWRAVIRSHKTAGYLPSQKNAHDGNGRRSMSFKEREKKVGEIRQARNELFKLKQKEEREFTSEEAEEYRTLTKQLEALT